MNEPTAIIVSPNEGKEVVAFGDRVKYHLTGEQTGGKLSVWTERVPAGSGPPPHRHLNEDEWFIVREGQFEFLANGEWCQVEPGSVIYLPKGSVHTFKNVGETEGELLISVSPSGFENYFRQCAEVFEKSSPPDMDAIMRLSEEFGIEFVN